MNNNAPLIDYWSYSSMCSMLGNPMAFKKTYILKQYDNLINPSGLVGSAAHKVLEMYFKGMERDAAVLEGQRIIDSTPDNAIKFGKTGTREQVIKAFTQAVNFVFAELPTFHELLGVEESITTDITTMMGDIMSVPAKAKIDIVARNRIGELEVHDWKFVKNYSNSEEDDFKHWLQGMFDYYIIKAKYGEAPARIVYEECKITGNKDKTPQLQPYTMEFNNADFATFERIYNDCTLYLNLPGQLFLPNPNDIFNGQETFELYRMDIMGVDRPVAAPHKTEQVQFAEKNFVPAVSDQAQNKELTMEERIRVTLQDFGVPVQMEETFIGPSVTLFTMKPSRGVAMSRIARTERELALALKAHSLRVLAPIPGTGLVGVEVPSEVRKTVELGDNHLRLGTLNIPVGVNVYNETVYKDLTDMPHLLIAGATGAGKSVMLNVILESLTKQMSPQQLKLVLIDPKQVELASYDEDPHLYQANISVGSGKLKTQGVITNTLEAVRTLDAMVKEMERRYKMLARQGVRSIDKYKGNMCKIVVVVDEFADLMMSDIKPSAESMDIKAFNHNLMHFIEQGSGRLTQKATKAAIKETLAKDTPPSAEESIIRIAQKSRAVGIHLILATQRPSADVVTGLIKVNVPTKICFMTTNKINSQIVLDATGAEELTGKGDMLFYDPAHSGLQRLQGFYA